MIKNGPTEQRAEQRPKCSYIQTGIPQRFQRRFSALASQRFNAP
jgi:hypothetical protein